MKLKSILLSVLFCCAVMSVSVFAEEHSVSGNWIEVQKNDKIMEFIPHTVGDIPVVYPDNDGEYHMGDCRVYAEKSNRDYTNSRYLTDVILDGTRCRVCMTDDKYFEFKECAYRKKLENYKIYTMLSTVAAGMMFFEGIIIIACILRERKWRR